VGDVARALTLMLLGVAGLCARQLRHARPGERSAGWGAHVLLLLLAGGLAWLLVPKAGLSGLPLAIATAAVVALLVDLLHRGQPATDEEAAGAPEQAASADGGPASAVLAAEGLGVLQANQTEQPEPPAPERIT
jgi:hypothetical protein